MRISPLILLRSPAQMPKSTANSSGTAIAEIEAGLCVATGAGDAKSAMKRLCNSVIKASKQDSTEVQVRRLLEVLDVPFVYQNTNSGAAQASVSIRDGRLVLEVPKPNFRRGSGMSKRWRFSIAHEFAHIVLIRTLGASVVTLTHRDRNTHQYVERLCDYAASHILLPRSKVLAEVRKLGFSRLAVDHIQRFFQVSETAALRAMDDLLPGGALFTIREFKRNDRETFEPRVSFCSSLYARGSGQPWLPQGCTMKHLELAEPIESMDEIKDPRFSSLRLSLNDKVWELDAVVLPWQFGRVQRDFFSVRLNVDLPPPSLSGFAIACAGKGKLDSSLFRSAEEVA